VTIPHEITALISGLYQEIDEVEQSATAGINLVRAQIQRFADSRVLIQLFAYLNNSLLFVETLRRRIEYSRLILSSDTPIDELSQEIGQDLAEQLGRVIEAKIGVVGVKNRLENW